MTNTQSLILVAVCVIAVVGGGGLLYFTFWISGEYNKQAKELAILKAEIGLLKTKVSANIETIYKIAKKQNGLS